MTKPAAPAIRHRRWSAGEWRQVEDVVAAEEPLQLLLNGEPLSIVMRTPGNDLELAIGLLWAERVITSVADVHCVRMSAESGEDGGALRVRADLLESNVVDIELRSEPARRPQRSLLSSSACGVCGATTIESLALDLPVIESDIRVAPTTLASLPQELRRRQRLFDATGGLHAAGLFTPDGDLLILREDVGRHNAVDKVVGRALLDAVPDSTPHLLAVSGRAGYEIVQKAAAAAVPVVVAVGAPSSLAIATAERFGLTLAGFARGDTFNVYTRPERVV